MKVAVLGARGMLGRYVVQHLRERKYSVLGLNRGHIDATVVDNANIDFYLQAADVVVNCAGVIKPRISSTGPTNTLLINSVFPHVLADYCEAYDKRLIHITTDCVFSGAKGKYKENDFHDAADLYGRSKSLGEPENCTTIRTSIIGEEKENQRSLIEWIKSQKGKPCNGFSTHWWNGITCLQYAKVIEKMIELNMFWEGVRHIHSPVDINKFYLLECINKIYDLGITVHELQPPECDRTLRSDFSEVIDLGIPEIPVQIQELKDFSLT